MEIKRINMTTDESNTQITRIMLYGVITVVWLSFSVRMDGYCNSIFGTAPSIGLVLPIVFKSSYCETRSWLA